METVPERSKKRWAIFAILSSMFILSQFYRVSNAVIAGELAQDLGLNAENLGVLGGAFFYSFAIVQLPMGAAIDRIGSRIMVALLPLIAALGAFLFALSQSFGLALFARLLIGIGMACVLMGTLKALTAWFRPDEFATMSGLTVSIGTAGTVLATSPLAYMTSILGWRISFVIIGIVTILMSATVFKVVRDRPGMPDGGGLLQKGHNIKEQIPIIRSLSIIFKSFAFWGISAATFFRYGTFVAIQGLWGGPYLMEILGYSPVKAGNTLMMMSLGTVIGAPLGGRLSDRVFLSRKKVVIIGMSAYGGGCFFLTGWSGITNEAFYYGLFFCLGFFSSFAMVLYSHVKELFDIRMAATAMTAINFFTMTGPAFFMPGMGKIIEAFPKVGGTYPPQAYSLAFSMCFVGIAIGTALYSFTRDTKPSGETALQRD
jgi:sugar phosphate permease